ncbi:t-complex 1 subunit beta [Fusarium albosuccineum]|uniref:T-complex 1 subunit beta n=1 Tax=Fusarium albosuccineum TaxID=1237068 RepID=A0A8H4L1G4_9HYPO|nr:t-complex 1 subunit beta [Fusarium albosuccineum]
MGQLKISDMLSSSQHSRPSSRRSATPHSSQPAASSSAGALGAHSNALGEHRPLSRSAGSTPLNRPTRPGATLPPLGDSDSRPAASRSTPISTKASQVKGKRQAKGVEDQVLQTPPQAQTRIAQSSASQHTPIRAAQLLSQGSSPHTPLPISSDSSSSDLNSDCEIQHVQPSPSVKRKVPATNPRGRPKKKTKGEQARPSQQPSASTGRNPAAGASRTASVPPQAPPPHLSSNSSLSNRASSVSTRAKPAIKAKFLPRQDDESDCYIEKVRPSPKRHRLSQQQKANVKRRRIINTKGISTSVGMASSLANEQEDSECEIVKIAPSPKRQTSSIPVAADSDADDESPEHPKPQTSRKIATPRKKQDALSNLAGNPRAPVAPAATPTRNQSQVSHGEAIDLTQDPTSDDSSAEETPATRPLAAQSLPAQRDSCSTQSSQAVGPESSTIPGSVREHAPSPEEGSQSDNQPLTPPPPSDDLTGPLMSFLDERLASMVTERDPAPESRDDMPHSTAPQYPYDDTELVRVKLESQDDMRPTKQEASSNPRIPSDIKKSMSSSGDDNDDSSLESSSDEMPGLSDNDLPQSTHEHYLGRSDFKDAPLIGEEKTAESASSPVSYQISSDGSEDLRSSPPASYELPLLDDNSPKSIKAEPETGPDDESDFDDLKDDLPRSVSNFRERLASSSSYVLKPVYSGDQLDPYSEPGTPGSFRPHHRDSLLGLRSILKVSKTQSGCKGGKETALSPFANISPLSGAEHALSSPSERNEPEREPISPKKRPITQGSTPAGFSNKPKSLADLRSRSWLPPRPNALKRPATPVPKNARGSWMEQRKRLTPLSPITKSQPSDDSDDSVSSQGTPSKPPTQRPTAGKQKVAKIDKPDKTLDTEQSKDNLQEELEGQQLEPVANNWSSPPREIKPQVIRDGVSEHAIKPAVARFEKKVAAGKGFNHTKPSSSNRKYRWKVDWTMPVVQTERSSRAMASELKHRGIKTDRQYGNFWYNLTMKYSRLAGSHVPLFTAKKKALDDFVEEAMQNERSRKREKVRKTKKQEKQEQRKQPEGVEAFLLAGDTDEESKSDASECTGEDLIAKMRADTEKQRKLTGGGTSCRRRRS